MAHVAGANRANRPPGLVVATTVTTAATVATNKAEKAELKPNT